VRCHRGIIATKLPPWKKELRRFNAKGVYVN
jgi:hypothetical protein